MFHDELFSCVALILYVLRIDRMSHAHRSRIFSLVQHRQFFFLFLFVVASKLHIANALAWCARKKNKQHIPGEAYLIDLARKSKIERFVVVVVNVMVIGREPYVTVLLNEQR